MESNDVVVVLVVVVVLLLLLLLLLTMIHVDRIGGLPNGAIVLLYRVRRAGLSGSHPPVGRRVL